MKINELLTESQLEQLDEGPIGRGIGKLVGGAARGIGAIAGGVVGAGTALKKGYQSGKAVVGDDPDPNAGAPGYTAPAEPNAAPGAALAKTNAVTDKQTTTKAGETVYAQVKANIGKLDKKGKQRILQLLTKSMAAPVAPPVKAPALNPAADPGATAFGQMANTLAKEPAAVADPAAAPVADPAAAPVADPAAAPKARGGRKAGAGPSMTPDAIRKRASREAAAAKAAAGNAAMGGMANQLQQQNASKNNYGNALSEALAQRVEAHKQKMFETGLSKGTISVFRK